MIEGNAETGGGEVNRRTEKETYLVGGIVMAVRVNAEKM